MRSGIWRKAFSRRDRNRGRSLGFHRVVRPDARGFKKATPAVRSRLRGRERLRPGRYPRSRSETDAWDIIEVKSSTEVKPVNIHDLALQRYAAEGAGLKIRKCFLMHIDNTYVRRGAVEPEKLFAREDVTARVAEELPNVEPNLAEMLAVLRQKNVPEIPIGPIATILTPASSMTSAGRFLPEDNPLQSERVQKRRGVRIDSSGDPDGSRISPRIGSP